MWRNFKEIKPVEGVEVIAFHHKWVSEEFNPRGIRIGFLTYDGFISAFWWDDQDTYLTISKNEVLSNPSFYESHLDNTEPEFWCEIDTDDLKDKIIK